MKAPLQLQPLADATGWSMLVQRPGQAVIIGKQRDGADAKCPKCETVILQNVVAGEVVEVAFRCAGCGQSLAAPLLPSGSAVPPVRVDVPLGIHHTWPTTTRQPDGAVGITSMENDHNAVIIGARAVARRRHETGNDRPPVVTRNVLDVVGIRAVVEEARTFFGDTLAWIERKHTRSAMHKTPPKSPHRLGELTSRLERCATEVEGGGGEVDVLAAIELSQTVATYRRWHADPTFRDFLSALPDPNHFRHDLVTLLAAGFLSEAGLGVEFVERASGRTADLRTVVSLRDDFRVEVKAPELATELGSTGLSARGRRLIVDALDDATEQIPEGVPGILLIGGPFWDEAQLRHIEAEAEALWAGKGSRRPMLAAVMVVSSCPLVSRRSGTESQPFDWSLMDLQGGIHGRWIPNAHYLGQLRLEFSRALVGPFNIKFRTPD